MGSRSASPETRVDDGTEAAEPILVGLVVRPHGLRGEVKIEIHSDVSDRFQPGRELLLGPRGRSGGAQTRRRRVRVASFRPIRGGGVLRLEGWETRESAEELRDARLEVMRCEVPKAPDGLYYHFELVGCRCIDATHGDLGEVVAVVEDGGGVLLEVSTADRTLPVPFVEAFLESVDVAGREIRLRLPPGLLESCASRS